VSETKRTIIATPLATVRPEVPRFAWDRRVPIGGPTTFAGTGGIGKSTILAWLVAGLTRGTLPGDLEGQPCNVGVISTEDHLASVLVPRLMAAECDLDRVIDLKARAEHEGEEWTENPTIAQDLTRLRERLVEKGVRVLIVDPVVSMQSGSSNDLADVRRDLNRLAALAYDLDLAVILVHHWNKGQGNASNRMSGSHAYRDAVRSVLNLVEDEDTSHRILGVDKSNYSNAREIPTLAFSIATTEVQLGDEQTATVGRAECLGETDVTVNDVATRTESNLGATAQDILELASERETVTAKEVSELLGCSGSSARQYLNRLKKKDHLQSVQVGTFQITDSGRAALTGQSATGATPRQRDSHPGSVTPLFHCQTHPQHPNPNGDCARCATDRNGDGTATDSDGYVHTVTGHWCEVCGWPTPGQTITTHPNCAPKALAG